MPDACKQNLRECIIHSAVITSAVNRQVSQVIMVAIIRCRRSYYRAPWTEGVAKLDRVNRGRTTSRSARSSRCHHCSTLQASTGDHHGGSISQGTPNDAWASRVLIDWLMHHLNSWKEMYTVGAKNEFLFLQDLGQTETYCDNFCNCIREKIAGKPRQNCFNLLLLTGFHTPSLAM